MVIPPPSLRRNIQFRHVLLRVRVSRWVGGPNKPGRVTRGLRPIWALMHQFKANIMANGHCVHPQFEFELQFRVAVNNAHPVKKNLRPTDVPFEHSLSSTLGVPSGGQQIWYLDVEPNSHPGHGVNTSFYEKTASLDCGWCSSSGYHQETIRFTIPTLGPILESAFIEREKNLEPISIRSSGFELELNPGKPALGSGFLWGYKSNDLDPSPSGSGLKTRPGTRTRGDHYTSYETRFNLAVGGYRANRESLQEVH
ncbi:hypothetical protein BKA70DRAFT_1236423 [Coprinopsis sp. MPI-PUGE-AT-0042]|nr:hypothetical protein BKA70DRAFT_1236423 [Coprinopsis sp. MPI-PUGE-AT-0042]